jgi:hypothetical protein
VRETDLVRSVLTALSQLGIWCWRVNAGRVMVAGRAYRGSPEGTPDILGVLDSGRLFGLEVKVGAAKLRGSQRAWHERAERSGVRVAVVRTTRQAVEIVQRWSREEP